MTMAMPPPMLISRPVRSLVAPALGRRYPDLAGLFANWPEIVGLDWAKKATPLGWRGSRQHQVLELGVNPAEALLVQHELPMLLMRINGYFGRNIVGQIKLKQVESPLSTDPLQTAHAAARRRKMATAQPVEGIDDPELAELLGRLKVAVGA